MSNLSGTAPKRTSSEAFTPKLVTVLREGYGKADFKADAVAGLTVAIVALPLSMAIAIASGLTPERGLFTAIVAGIVISALGGSRHQIGGPAGAFIVLVASIVERHGYNGLVLATAMAGVMMMAAGWFRLGTVIHYIPFPVVVGFTAGIAAIIFASQIRDLLGLDMAREPAAILPKLEAIVAALGTIKPTAVALSIAGIALIFGLRRWRPTWPGLLIAVVLLAVVTALFGLDVATIGSRFGGVPSTLPAPVLPPLDVALAVRVFPDAFAIALLGAIESLLCAVVADGMTGRRHRSNVELVAQGAANIAVVTFGGFCATGTIARTATNIRAGARTPVAGVLHSLYLLAFMLLAAPLASYIPLAALAAVLVVVAWNMSDLPEFVRLVRSSRADALVVLVTFGLTTFADLTMGIAAGLVISAVLVLMRMAGTVEVSEAEGATVASPALERSPDVMVYRISGAFFFGATSAVTNVLDQIGARPKIVVLDVSGMLFIDSTAARAVERFAERLKRSGVHLKIAGADRKVRHELIKAGVRAPLAQFISTGDVRLLSAQQPTSGSPSTP